MDQFTYDDHGWVYQNCIFHDLRERGFSCEGVAKSYSEYEQIIMLLSSAVVDSYLFYDVAVHFQI